MGYQYDMGTKGWCECRSWQTISHELNSNPWPASFLNMKGNLRLSRVLIPGNQTFVVSLLLKSPKFRPP